MAVKNYYSFGGEILAEETGGVRRDYLTDAHGSVTATVTGAGAIENTYRYKPYGETLAKTGAGSDPKFLWNGKWGYRRGASIAYMYVRARTYHAATARWTIIDLLWPEEPAYTYVNNNPLTLVDSTGMGGMPAGTTTPGMACVWAYNQKLKLCPAPGCNSPLFRRAYNACRGNTTCQCALVLGRLAGLRACFEARRWVTAACFGGIQDVGFVPTNEKPIGGHELEEDQLITAIDTCTNMAGGCGVTLPPLPVKVPALQPIPKPVPKPFPNYIIRPVGPLDVNFSTPAPANEWLGVCGELLLAIAASRLPVRLPARQLLRPVLSR